MGRIVTRHVAVETLPEEVRKGLARGAKVTVTVEEEKPRPQAPTYEELKAEIDALPKTTDDPVERVRKLRDEWGE